MPQPGNQGGRLNASLLCGPQPCLPAGSVSCTTPRRWDR